MQPNMKIAVMAMMTMTVEVAQADPGSCDIDCVNARIAAAVSTTMVSVDEWATSCAEGRFNSSGWCYGDIASAPFISLNAKLGDMVAKVGITVTSTQNSIFIAHYLGTNTNGNVVPITSNQSPSITSNTPTSTTVFCAYYSPAGASLMSTGFAASYGSASAAITAPLTKITSGSFGAVGNVAIKNDPIPETAEFYLVCIGTGSEESLWYTPQTLNTLTPS